MNIALKKEQNDKINKRILVAIYKVVLFAKLIMKLKRSDDDNFNEEKGNLSRHFQKSLGNAIVFCFNVWLMNSAIGDFDCSLRDNNIANSIINFPTSLTSD